MPRPGITQDDVACALSALKSEGMNPTVRLVREYLGSGSSTTILRHMAAVRAASAPRPETAPAVPDELIEQLQELWTTSLDLASKENEALRQAVHVSAYRLSKSKEVFERVMNGVMKQVDSQITTLHEIGDMTIMPAALPLEE